MSIPGMWAREAGFPSGFKNRAWNTGALMDTECGKRPESARFQAVCDIWAQKFEKGTLVQEHYASQSAAVICLICSRLLNRYRKKFQQKP